MAEVSGYNPNMFVWVDETGCDRRKSIRQYGYSIRGMRAVCHHLSVGGKCVSAIPVLTTHAWNWKCFHHNWYGEWWSIWALCSISGNAYFLEGLNILLNPLALGLRLTVKVQSRCGFSKLGHSQFFAHSACSQLAPPLYNRLSKVFTMQSTWWQQVQIRLFRSVYQVIVV